MDDRSAIQYAGGQRSLFGSTFAATPFNIILGTLLAVNLFYNRIPIETLILWLGGVVVLSIIRMIYCKFSLNKTMLHRYDLTIFMILTTSLGLVWSSIYFLAMPYTNILQLYLICLFYAGMSSGSTSTLGIYLPAFLAYTLSMFLPVIIYNYSLRNFDNSIFATMCVFYIAGITFVAKSHQKILRNIFSLTEENNALLEKFEKISITDELTGLYNKRHFTEIFLDEFNRAKRNKYNIALVVIDVDNFKLINDNLGHPFGDLLLKHIAGHLQYYAKRANDMIFRQGGDEFAILFLNADEMAIHIICNKIKNEFLKIPKFDYSPQDIVHQTVMAEVTLSIGVLYIPYDSQVSIDEVIEKADQLLYRSKNKGKNLISYGSIAANQ